MLFKARFVYCSNLLKKHCAVFRQTAVRRAYVDMRRYTAFVMLACYSCCDDSRAMSVSDIVLDYEHGTDSALFRADDGA